MEVLKGREADQTVGVLCSKQVADQIAVVLRFGQVVEARQKKLEPQQNSPLKSCFAEKSPGQVIQESLRFD